MTGQIPKYGKYLVRASTPYHPYLANTVYMWRPDHTWYIRSDKTSKKWWIFHGSFFGAVPVSVTLPSMGRARDQLIEGIQRGFYATGQPVLLPPRDGSHYFGDGCQPPHEEKRKEEE